ncbi:cytidylate kinase [Ruminiclostridium hungatei]|uniref:Cytidylate kinase n=1 Tax=Ruminiclostridium hungatei TaxID=48256 RepID=A0A1V4SMV2_RUMHU|nr:AAA family ATPase [Ruminiclostridium hungatei]OPX45154.1 cytidylate kinase [Ruminiclostridium hungatei]
MNRHIHILGASGSGTTTLAGELSKLLGYEHFDSDDYFWLPTIPPFTEKRPVSDRIQLLEKDLKGVDSWILSGSNCGWGDFLISSYDLVVFLYVPPEIRIKRLIQREIERYSIERISHGGDLYESHKAFIEWAAAYDTAGLEMRSLALHNEWLKRLNCGVIRLEGTQSVEERIRAVLRELERQK